jgi:hypothetical protein
MRFTGQQADGRKESLTSVQSTRSPFIWSREPKMLHRTPSFKVPSSCKHSCRRNYSNAHPNYSPKVRGKPGNFLRHPAIISSRRTRLRAAFPFAFSTNEATTVLGPYASIACMFKGFFHSLAARFFGSGFTPIQPTKIQAVYLPAWFIDAELKANAWLTSKNETQQVKCLYLRLRIISERFLSE